MTQTTDQHTGTAADRAAVPVSGLPDDPEKTRDGRSGLVPVLAFAGIVVAVMQTLLVPLIKDLPALLGTAPSNATWVMTSTLLAGAVATPIMGRLGDLYGKRRMLLASLFVMIVGSLVCGFTSALIVMIVGRALQGFAMGAIPLGIGLMRDELPREKLGSAMALMSSSIGVGGGLALPAAALIAQHLDWHALFFAAALLGALSIGLTLLVVPESSRRAGGRFDLPGALGLSLGLVLLLLPVTKGSDWGWTAPGTLGLFGGAVAVLLLWGRMELRSAAPLVDLRTTARREVLLTNLASIMVGVAFYAISLVLPQLLQLPAATGYGLGKSMVAAGLCVAPLGLTMMLTAPLYARISATYGPKVSLIIGMIVIAAGYGGGLGLMGSAWQTVIISVVVGAGIGLAYSSLPALIIGAVDASETGAANGLNTLMRSIGTSVSSAVIGMVLARTAHQEGQVAVPTLHGFRVSFLIAAAAVAVGLVIAAFLPSRARAAGGRPHLRASSTDGVPAAGPGTPGEPGGGAGPVPAYAAATAGAPSPAAAAPLPSGAVAPGARPVLEVGAAPVDATRTPATATAGSPASPAPGAPLRGRVTDPSGAPVPRARVTLLDGRGRRAGTAVTGDDGRFTLAARGTDGHVLAATARGHAPTAAALPPAAPASATIDLTLRPVEDHSG